MAERYTPASHIDRVIKGSSARNSARVLLLEICRRSEFDKPESTFTKEQVSETTQLSPTSVVRALRELRKEGVIVPVKGYTGGRGVAATYRLCIVGEGPEAAPEPKGRKVSVERFSDWCKRHGYDGAAERKRRYENGETIDD